MKRTVRLPAPQKDLDYRLMEALEKRRSTRSWKDAPLDAQELSNLLWAACGISKKAYGNVKSKRTAPSACNSQEIRVYLLTADGAFLYDEERHCLVEILRKDIRTHIGTQKMVKSAPMGLVFVSAAPRRLSTGWCGRRI